MLISVYSHTSATSNFPLYPSFFFLGVVGDIFLFIGKLFFSALLQIGGTDARSLAEIKRRRTCCTLSIYFGVATTQMPAYLQKTRL